MGEIADAMLEGDLCEGCGCYLDDEGGSGFPRYCSEECARGRGADPSQIVGNEDVPPPVPRHPKDTLCPQCGKLCRGAKGLAQHKIDRHNAPIIICECGKRCLDTAGLAQHKAPKHPNREGLAF